MAERKWVVEDSSEFGLGKGRAVARANSAEEAAEKRLKLREREARENPGSSTNFTVRKAR
jgi:hypothetical protein